MEQHTHLDRYRDRLLERLRRQLRPERTKDVDCLQVFVNQECIGTLDCAAKRPTLVYTSRERRVQMVEIRSDTGTLVAGMCAQEQEMGVKTGQFTWSRQTIEITVHNRADGGSLKVSYQAAPAWLPRLLGVRATLTGLATGERSAGPAWPKAWAISHAVLAAAVLFLLADRSLDWWQPQGAVTEGVADTSAGMVQKAQLPQADFDRLQNKLDDVVHQLGVALETVRTQQEEITDLRRTLEVVTKTQERLNTNVLTVQREAGSRHKGVQREVESLTRLLLSKAQEEREQLRAELQSLTIANDMLTKEVADLGTQNRELKDKLKSAGVDVSKAMPAVESNPAVAGTPKAEYPPTQIAESHSETSRSPLTFWVSFHEGTSEESIQHLVEEVRGRRGPVNAGWYPVEVMLPPPNPPDRFLDSLRQTKIVKAVSTTQVVGLSR